MLDTRKATLPTIGFKGLLLPSAVTIRRLPADPARPAIVDYQVTLPDTGPFEGQLNTKNGWTPVRGWSERTELIIEGDTRTGALANLRVARIVLNGRPAVGDVPRRNAEISRIKAGATVPALTEPLPDDAMAGHVDGAQIIIAFDELGRPSASWPNGTVKGDINFLNMRDVSDSPKPKPKPAP